MEAEMTGKVALVTGASRGIGAAVARAFREAGARVALAARSAEELEWLADGLGAVDGGALAIPADVSDPMAVEAMVARAVEKFGRLDYACNNAAGGGHAPTPLAAVPVEAFDSGVAVSLRGVFLSMRAEIPAMLESDGGGAIVNMSSTAGSQAVGGLGTYVAAKHGVEGLTKVAALDYAAEGVRVNAVAPGPILTDNLKRAGAGAREAAAKAMPMRRVGTPEEVAAAVVWLCSEAAGFVTGTTLTIDGGKLAGTPPFRVKAAASAG
ncbi:MAG TPA: SDR family NAD(P)-dependent oxidoreductase [Solirubrobacterales bacterium]|jgi:NAD(P)-dependent dehydrogenase (short-subunit alcohol dehydrogenase family)|nr:SDR family NAD(P)-dependent oxidoreductase [Solirubrobacterales bacterium]